MTDGERIVVWYGSAGLHCYDMDGNQQWSRDLGKQRHMWGYAASPVLSGDLCILSFGPGMREFLIAVDRRTGETRWQLDALDIEAEAELVTQGSGGSAEGKEQAADSPGKRAEILRGSWSTPLITSSGGRQELIVSHPHRITSYDPATGKPLWTCRGLGPLVYTSPIAGDGVLVAMSGYHGASMAVRLGGNGDVTETHRMWHIPRGKLWLGSGIVHNEYVFTVDMRGIAYCINAEDGKTVWEQRLKGGGEKGSGIWSSPLMSGDRIYLLNKAGKTFVYRAGSQFELIAQNSLEEPTNSSIVASGGNLYIRTHKALWCIGEK